MADRSSRRGGRRLLIELEDVSVTYGAGPTLVRAARDVSLSIPAGDALGLVGESGSGKSTVLRAVAGLIPHAEGSVVIDGRELSNRRPRESAFEAGLRMSSPFSRKALRRSSSKCSRL